MAGSGSEKRRKTRSILVRVTEAEHDRLMELAAREMASCAEYLRRRIGDQSTTETDDGPGADAPLVLSEADRTLLAGAVRSAGHLVGIVKRATFEVPAPGRARELRDALEAHQAEFLQLQGQLRAFLERHK